MNSTLAVSRQTLQILQEEFNRGHEIVDKCWKSFQQNPNAPPDSEVYQNAWKALFRPSDFFIAYPNYMSLCIVGPSQAEAQAWAGFVESRLRKLVSDLLARSLPLKKIQLWPKKINGKCGGAEKSHSIASSRKHTSLRAYFLPTPIVLKTHCF
jgi:poly(A) polymerase